MKPQKKKELEKKKKKKQPKNTIEKRKQYSDDSLKKALDAIESGMPKKQAAKQFQVPRATLQFRIKNPNHKPLPGPSPVLNEEEENQIKNWLTVSHKKGFPKRKEDVLKSVSEFVKKCGRPNPFKDNIPGEKWFKLFLKRHPDISIRTPEAVTSASAAVSENDIKGWFKDIEEYLKEQNLFEILLDPRRVLNGDETNFVLCAKTGVVLAPKGAKNVYEVDHAPAKTSLTVMFTFAADGETTPPMVIFPYKRLPSEIASKVPSDWGIGLSENGWMKAEIFSQYIEKVLHPHLIKKGVPFPVILFVDGHKTHLTYVVSELCSVLNIVLVALYPNCTRLLQPADVSAFRPLKGGWQKTVLEWRRDNPAKALTKADFVPLLQKTVEKCVKPSTIINGFRTTGLYPWNPDAVDYTKYLGKKFKINKTVNEDPETESHRVMTKRDFLKIVGTSTLEEIIAKKNMAEMILKKVWDHFNEKKDQQLDSVQTTQSVVNSKKQKNSETNENENTNTDNKDCNENIQLSEISKPNSIQEQDFMDIESMNIIFSEGYDTSDYILAKEVLVEDIVCLNTENKCNDNGQIETNFQANIGSKYSDSDDDSQTIDYIQVSHKVEIESYREGNYSRTENVQINNETHSNKQIITPAIVYPPEPDIKQIEILSVEKNPTFTTPLKTNLRQIKLDDILVFPKTPQRKGVRNTKKTSFVVTSGEFKEEELKKIKDKKEKEEGIKKRKEEREQKKIQAKAKQVVKKKKQVAKPKVKSNLQKTENVKKILFSEEFTNLNIDIPLKLKDVKKEKIEPNIKNTQEKNKENCEIIQKSKNDAYNNSTNMNNEKCKVEKKKSDEGELIQNFPEIMLDKPKKIDAKRELKNKLYVKESSSSTNTDEDEVPDYGRVRTRKIQRNYSVAEIEKMLND